ncbi:MAG: shikimate dehydrogenase [Myxococcales bacterium]|nr:shikimate dehydrogenase [Myxococcales bacterium]
MRRCFGVFGDPIAHSRSPAMHSAAFAALGLDHAYLPFRVEAAVLERALRGAAALGFGGVNLTVPHKRAALAIVDALSDAAARIGAVNTIIFMGDGRMLGDNTDSPGFAAALSELPGARPRRAVVLGGGGASRAVVDALLHEVGVDELAWVSRDPSRLRWEGAGAERLRRSDYGAIAARLDAELLVNCTTIGMHGGPADFPIALPLDTMEGEARVIDIVYPRPSGGLLDRAEALGAAVQDGLPMLLWQGVRALERWLERELPADAVAAMRAAITGS